MHNPFELTDADKKVNQDRLNIYRFKAGDIVLVNASWYTGWVRITGDGEHHDYEGNQAERVNFGVFTMDTWAPKIKFSTRNVFKYIDYDNMTLCHHKEYINE